uniref:Aquaporin n=1 Tax=Glossina morsitans morsitans TaxID=37546 RepID=D3TNZ0_GLOMM|nr:aquaporin 4b [Glossina morsitans morsitans]
MKPHAWKMITCFVSEFIGAFMLVFLGCMGCISTPLISNNHFQMCFNFGLVVMIVVQCCACVSGAHANPAISIAALIYGTLTLPMTFIYCVAQMLGAFMGYGLLRGILPEVVREAPHANHALCVTTVHPELYPLQGVFVEFIATGILLLICCAVWDARNANYHDSVSIRFGLAVACLAITAGPYTGCSMNPARSFAPALWNVDFTDHWVYWLGPISGAITATCLWKYILRAKEEKKIIEREELPLN